MSTDKLKNSILKKIQAGEVAMTPRWHFVLKTVLVVTGVVLTVLGLLYVLSFVLFVLRATGVLFVPYFGFHGVIAFLQSTPWLLVALALVFVVALELLVRQFAFAYKKPLLTVLGGIVLIGILGTIAIAQTPLHTELESRAHMGRLPIMGAVYREYGEQISHVAHVGTISALDSDGFVLVNRRGSELEVRLTEETKIPRHVVLSEGMAVVVLGTVHEGRVVAEGIRSIPPEVLEMRGPLHGAAQGGGQGARGRGMWAE